MLTELTILACFITGITSTLHCFGMCGGISTMLSMQSDNPELHRAKYINAFLYNTGRIFSYGVIGFIAGIGTQFTSYHFFANGHSILQVISSVILISIALHILGWFSSFQLLEKLTYVFWKKIRVLTTWILPAKSPLAVFSLGLVWGWLPCGMVYSVLLLAISSANAFNSMLYMLAFGLGTLPGMFATSVGSAFLNSVTKKNVFRYFSASLLICIALLPLYSNLFTGEHHHHDNGSHSSHHHH